MHLRGASLGVGEYFTDKNTSHWTFSAWLGSSHSIRAALTMWVVTAG
jgi:hypothetical protein